jgi:hypothetical protein
LTRVISLCTTAPARPSPTAESTKRTSASATARPNLASQFAQLEERTGKAGDFVILHPFMPHASSQNARHVPRFMSNPPMVLKQPMNLRNAVWWKAEMV